MKNEKRKYSTASRFGGIGIKMKHSLPNENPGMALRKSSI
jgi:hypothetical protein